MPEIRGATFVIGTSDNRLFITCLKCRRSSFNENDIKHRYCGTCGFHEGLVVARLSFASDAEIEAALNDLYYEKLKRVWKTERTTDV